MCKNNNNESFQFEALGTMSSVKIKVLDQTCLKFYWGFK